MGMESHLAQLLRSNDSPSDMTIREIKDLVKTELKEIEEIDAQITTLKAQLKFLRKRRDIIQKSVDNYRTILSPIRRLPTDLLHEIFYHCLLTHRNSLISPSEAPMLLTHVCSKWRATSLSSPRLWSQLHIAFSDDCRAIALGETSQLKMRALAILKKRCEIVKDWLIRSASCPLSISILYVGGTWRESRKIATAREDEVTRELFKIILSCIERWETLELTMPIAIYCQLEAMISSSQSTPTSLTTLKLSLHYHIPQIPPVRVPAATVPIAILNAPHLRRMSLGGSLVRANWPWNAAPSPTFGQRLTYFCCYVSLNYMGALILFKECCNIVYCKISLAPETLGLGGSTTSDTFGVVSLPHLLLLSIKEDNRDLAMSTRFYSLIDAPRLKWISYQSRPCSSHGPAPTPHLNPDIPSSFITLLQKSGELTKLTIDAWGLKAAILRSAIEAASASLKHLIIRQESIRGPLENIGTYSYFLRPPAFDLEWLLVSNGHKLESSSSESVLLPHLEIFEWSAGIVPDTTVLRFVTERMEPPPTSGVVALKCVRITFDRPQEIDVCGEVTQYWKENVGLDEVPMDDMELELSYPPPKVKQKEVDPLSSSYVLSHGDRTWHYPEIDESFVPT